jgi:hypothetical protein
MDSRTFRDIDWQLLFIRVYTWLSVMFETVGTQTVKSTKYLVESFKPTIYCLYKGSFIPVRLNDYSKDVVGAGTVEYYYNRDAKVISKTLDVTHIPRTLNIEGASVYHGDICLYDLTDFFDTTRYAGSNDVPSLSQWLGIWELENGIYLDRNTDFEIHVDFLGAGSEIFTPWVRTSRDRWGELTSSAPRLHRQVFRALNTNCSCTTTLPTTNAVVYPNTEVCESTTPCDLSGNVTTDLSGNAVVASEEKEEEVTENLNE